MVRPNGNSVSKCVSCKSLFALVLGGSMVLFGCDANEPSNNHPDPSTPEPSQTTGNASSMSETSASPADAETSIAETSTLSDTNQKSETVPQAELNALAVRGKVVSIPSGIQASELLVEIRDGETNAFKNRQPLSSDGTFVFNKAPSGNHVYVVRRVRWNGGNFQGVNQLARVPISSSNQVIDLSKVSTHGDPVCSSDAINEMRNPGGCYGGSFDWVHTFHLQNIAQVHHLGGKMFQGTLFSTSKPFQPRRAEIDLGRIYRENDILDQTMDLSGELGEAAFTRGQWHVLGQMNGKQHGKWGVYPFGLQAREGKLRLTGKHHRPDRNGNWGDNWMDQPLADWVDGKVYRIRLRAKLSHDPNGLIEVWVNDRYFSFKAQTLRDGQDEMRWRAGLYRGKEVRYSFGGPTYEQQITVRFH